MVRPGLGNGRAALNAYKASLVLVDARTVRAAYLDLRTREGFRVTDHTVDADSATPRACVTFSEPLVKLGVDRRAVAEALGMAIYMGGGPSLMYAADALEAYDQFQQRAVVSEPAMD